MNFQSLLICAPHPKRNVYSPCRSVVVEISFGILVIVKCFVPKIFRSLSTLLNTLQRLSASCDNDFEDISAVQWSSIRLPRIGEVNCNLMAIHLRTVNGEQRLELKIALLDGAADYTLILL